VIPYADFTSFGLLLYAVVPTLILGLLGRANWRWALLLTAIMLLIQYQAKLKIGAHAELREIWIVVAFGFWQWTAMRVYAAIGARGGSVFYATVAVCIFPLALAKVIPVFLPGHQFGFLGLSYITFRALDVVFCLRDNVIAAPRPLDFLGFLFFFPTISAGPIDRFRRFTGDWKKKRTRAEFVIDLDAAVHRIFRGFLYKFILAALIKQYWLDSVGSETTFGALVSYMYAYSFYLFFDFAGYSAFAIAFSYLLGIHTPENFNRPFLARNIRDFWNRWHITLSFWFRDFVYMRFLMAVARRGRWIAGRNVTAIIGYFLSFGLMGLWHGIEPHFIIYGIYQATLLSGFHLFSEWTKIRAWPTNSRLWRAGAIFVTFHFVCFGFLIFSGRLGAGPEFNYVGVFERADCDEISGWALDKHQPNSLLSVDLHEEKQYVATIDTDQFREDLRDAGYGNGRHAFRVQTPVQFKDGRPHVLSISVSRTKKKISPTPRIIRCPATAR
jgi:membrane protein involved in D-alanine export